MEIENASRQDAILLDLLNQEEGFLNTATWCLKYGVSQRTIQNELRELHIILKKYNLILSKTKGGNYQILRLDSKSEQAIQNLMLRLQHHYEQRPSNTQNGRVIYLLKMLLLSNEYTTLMKLADTLYISRSTISKDIKKTKKILASYEIILSQKPHYGIKISGNEEQIRACIFDYGLIDHQVFSPSASIHIWSQILHDDQYSSVEHIVCTTLEENGFKMYGAFLSNLITHVYIAIKRTFTGCYVEYQEALDMHRYPQETLVAKALLKQINETFSIRFPQSEEQYLLVHLIGKRMYEEHDNTIFLDDVYHLIERMLKQASRTYNCLFEEDEMLKTDLYTHLKAVISRLEVGGSLRNPLLHEIKARYPLAFEIAVYCMKNDWNYLSSISEDELGYIAIHFAASLERSDAYRSIEKKKKVLLLCASGVGTARLMEVKIQRYFKDRIDLIPCPWTVDNKQIDFLEYDLVLTTLPLTNSYDNVMLLHAIPNEHEIELIQKRLFPKEHGSPFSIQQIFRKEFFTIKNYQSKTEVLHDICLDLQKADIVENAFEDAVWLRENSASTNVGNYVALPHAIKPMSKESLIYTCILKSPILWDDEEVQIIFLLAIKFRDSQYFSNIYDLLVQIVEDADLVSKCIQCQNYKQFLSVLEVSIQKDEKNE